MTEFRGLEILVHLNFGNVLILNFHNKYNSVNLERGEINTYIIYILHYVFQLQLTRKYFISHSLSKLKRLSEVVNIRY